VLLAPLLAITARVFEEARLMAAASRRSNHYFDQHGNQDPPS